MAKYHCVGGVAGAAGVDLEALVTPKLAEGGMLNVGWSLKYLGSRRFGSPGFFVQGSQLSLEGTVDITGAWHGQLYPKGDAEQDALVPGSYMKLPEGLSDTGSVQRAGSIRVAPTNLVVRFTPAQGEVMVNDDEGVTYPGGTWTHEITTRPYGDFMRDLHKTTDMGATARLDFKGTQVTYVSRREQDLGKIQIKLDGQTVTDGLVEPGKDVDGTDMIGTKPQQELWTSPELEYGPHRIEITNTEGKTGYVDAIKVVTGEITEPPLHDQATCTLTNNPGAIDITVPGATTPPPSTSPPPTSPTPTTTGTNTQPPGTTPPPHVNSPTPSSGLGYVVVLPRASGTRTATVT
ncbi:MAG: hypothetical protein HOY71_17350, partial [Nonomuraea sp.]|nr:hypothetical protein [Nonomuraea sp.]